MNKPTLLTRDDLRGRPAISYFRFSSSQQRHGSSIERQEVVFGEVLEHFGLTVARGFEDRGLSGSKGHNRTRGQLCDLLAMIRRGEIARGTILVVEDIHRLSREGALTVWPILSDIVNAGMVLVTGVTRTIWCEARLNSSENHALQAAINGAAEYAANLSHMATSAHASRRRKMAEGKAVVLNGRMPGWIDRDILPDGEKGGYTLNGHAETIRRIFSEAGEGRSVRAIVDGMNRDNVPMMHGESGEWCVQRIAAILKDRHVLGFHTPKRRREGAEPEVLGAERKVYPAAIDDAAWDRARGMMESKRTLAGRPGGTITNLFTGKAFCATCAAPMRVDTSGGIRKGRRRKDFICARHIESKTCPDDTRYDLHYFERPILMALIRWARIAPRAPTPDTQVFDDQIGRLRIEIEDREASLEVIRPKIGKSPVLAEQFDRLADELDKFRKRRVELEEKRVSAKRAKSRLEETWQLMRELFGPALCGDVDARDRLRGMLAPVAFRIIGAGHGSLHVECDGWVEHILAEADFRELAAVEDHAFEDALV